MTVVWNPSLRAWTIGAVTISHDAVRPAWTDDEPWHGYSTDELLQLVVHWSDDLRSGRSTRRTAVAPALTATLTYAARTGADVAPVWRHLLDLTDPAVSDDQLRTAGTALRSWAWAQTPTPTAQTTRNVTA